MQKRIVTESAAETIELGRNFGELLEPGDVVALTGDLAAGKTTLIKGICDTLGVNQDVASPTFTLINEYEGEIPVYHMDCYRENSISGWIDIGVEEYFYGDGIAIVEWAEMIKDILPPKSIKIFIEQDYDQENWREFTIIIPENSRISKKDLQNLNSNKNPAS